MLLSKKRLWLPRRKFIAWAGAALAAPYIRKSKAALISSSLNNSASQLPAGVTLQAIDGGPTYYADNGFTYAALAGWDSPSFFPIGLWMAPLRNQSDANRWLDLGLNTAFAMTGDSN